MNYLKITFLLVLGTSVTSAFVPSIPATTQVLQLARNSISVTAQRQPSLLFADTKDDKETAAVEKKSEDNILKQIKDSGVAGSISLFIWEAAFWAISIPVALVGYNKVTGHWPDVSDKEDLSTLGASAFAFANAARFALPIRLGLALGTTPWVQENIVDTFMNKEDTS